MNEALPPIIVAHVGRCGSSLLAGILHTLGAFGGSGMDFCTPDNPKGFFEHGAWNSNVLHKLATKSPKWVRDHTLAIMLGDGLQPDQPWCIKWGGHHLPGGWQTVDRAFPTAKWLLPLRDVNAIVASRIAMAKRNGRAPRDAEATTDKVKALVKTQAAICASVANVEVIFPKDAILGNYKHLRTVVEWAGLTWNEEAVNDFVDPELWHHE